MGYMSTDMNTVCKVRKKWIRYGVCLPPILIFVLILLIVCINFMLITFLMHFIIFIYLIPRVSLCSAAHTTYYHTLM